MSAPGVGVQLLNRLYHAGTYRVQVDVTYQLKKIGVFFADYGLVTILEKMARTLMAKVEDNGITGEQSSHEYGKLCRMRTQQQMEVAGQERPGETSRPGLGKEFREPLHKQSTVIVIKEYVSPLDPSDDDMLKNVRYVYSCCAWHALKMTEKGWLVNNSTMSPWCPLAK